MVQTSHILLLDADLYALRTEDILALLAPVQDQHSSITMAFIKNARPLFPFKQIDYCSGQRVLPLSLFKGQLTKLASLPSYGLEVFINRLMISAKTSLNIVHRPQVENTFHHSKAGRRKGRKKNLTIRRHIIQIAGGFLAIYKMNFDLQKLLLPPQK
ncbi:MAG: hypothetical protein Q4B28_03575 [bacterium]|nr:hypothetical protein [bacterium]